MWSNETPHNQKCIYVRILDIKLRSLSVRNAVQGQVFLSCSTVLLLTALVLTLTLLGHFFFFLSKWQIKVYIDLSEMFLGFFLSENLYINNELPLVLLKESEVIWKGCVCLGVRACVADCLFVAVWSWHYSTWWMEDWNVLAILNEDCRKFHR